MKIYLYQRLRNGVRSPFYSYRFTLHGKVHPRQTQFTNKDDARRKAQAHILALEKGVHQQVAHLFTQRAARAAVPTLPELFAVQEQIAIGLMRPESALSARLQLLNILRRARPALNAQLSTLNELTASLVSDYADATTRAAVAENAGERRLLQMQRSANSTHAAACVLFTRKMRDRYPKHGITLPPCIAEFCAHPPFPDVDTEHEYHEPADTIIRATLHDLETVQREKNPNLYCAVWLALGFGLRKGEIFGARRRNIYPAAGKMVFQLEENWVARRRRDLPKNYHNKPIQEANDAWAKLAPLLAGHAPEDYITRGPHHSARTEYVARDVSRWMRDLGWGTQKTLHAWRAYAIAQIVKSHGMKQASLWARHASILVTERSYGHFITLNIDSVPLTLPPVPAEFKPQLVHPVSPPVTSAPSASQDAVS